MTENHSFPITPPPELVQQWCREADNNKHIVAWLPEVVAKTAQWGADQELEACCEWIHNETYDDCATAFSGFIANLRAARRPKPPSLKEQALKELGAAILRGDCFSTSPAKDTIRRALESIPDLS